jgi:hypothetical protein
LLEDTKITKTRRRGYLVGEKNSCSFNQNFTGLILRFVKDVGARMWIYYLNKHWDAGGLGHAGVVIPEGDGGYVYYSFFASRKLVPMCKGTLLVKRFGTVEEALAYAKEEGYTREVHWEVDAVRAAAARGAVEGFATGTRWRLIGRNCWTAVHAALTAAGMEVHTGRGWPNRHFWRNKGRAAGWSNL